NTLAPPSTTRRRSEAAARLETPTEPPRSSTSLAKPAKHSGWKGFETASASNARLQPSTGAAQARAIPNQDRTVRPDGDAEMHEPMLDGNALAGLLREVFAVEMNRPPGRAPTHRPATG